MIEDRKPGTPGMAEVSAKFTSEAATAAREQVELAKKKRAMLDLAFVLWKVAKDSTRDRADAATAEQSKNVTVYPFDTGGEEAVETENYRERAHWLIDAMPAWMAFMFVTAYEQLRDGVSAADIERFIEQVCADAKGDKS